MGEYKASKTKNNALHTLIIMILTPLEKFTTIWNIIITLILMFAPPLLSIRIESYSKIIYNLKWEYQIIYILTILVLLIFWAAYRIQSKIKSYEAIEGDLIKLNQLRFDGIKIQTRAEKYLLNKREFQNGFGFNQEVFDEIKLEICNWMKIVIEYLEENNPAFVGKFKMLGRFDIRKVMLPAMIDKNNNIYKEATDLMHHIARLDRLDRIIDLLEEKLLSLD